MTIEEACELWLRCEFSNVSKQLVKKAYRDDPGGLELVSSKKPVLDYPCGWGWLYMPDNQKDEDWILTNVEQVQACGFIVYKCDECGVLLGIDATDYSFFAAHWLPLYKARGLTWHLQN